MEKERRFSTGANVLVWWEGRWFRTRELERYTDMSTTVLFIDMGNIEQLPPGQVVLPRKGLPGYLALTRLPDWAVHCGSVVWAAGADGGAGEGGEDEAVHINVQSAVSY